MPLSDGNIETGMAKFSQFAVVQVIHTDHNGRNLKCIISVIKQFEKWQKCEWQEEHLPETFLPRPEWQSSEFPLPDVWHDIHRPFILKNIFSLKIFCNNVIF